MKQNQSNLPLTLGAFTLWGAGNQNARPYPYTEDRVSLDGKSRRSFAAIANKRGCEHVGICDRDCGILTVRGGGAYFFDGAPDNVEMHFKVWS